MRYKLMLIVICAILIASLILIGVATQAQEITYIPTSIPNEPGSHGDGVSRINGGIFHGGIAVAGSQDESQLVIQEFSAQTQVPLVIQNTSGTPVFSVGSDGSIDSPIGLDPAVMVSIPTAQTTATPGVYINSVAANVNALLISNATTPVAYIDDDGNAVFVGVTASGFVAAGSSASIAVPTAQTTATPGLYVNSSAANVDALVVANVGTPVASIDDDGNGVLVDLAISGNLTLSDGNASIAVPTAQATATPALLINNTAADGDSLVIAKAATPVAYSDLDGNLTAASLTTGGTLGVTGRSTLTGGYTGVVNVENIMGPSVLAVSITYTAAAGGTGTVATITDGEIWIIHSVLVNVTTNFDATGDDATLVIGDGNDADGFVVLADAELQAADTEGTGFAAGWQGMADATIGVYLDEVDSGFVYAPSGADETIDWLLDETTDETLAAGEATIYVVYTRIQ